MKKYIAADGGGTKTKYLLLDENKNELFSLTGPGTNPVHTGTEAALASLREHVHRLLEESGTGEREISGAALFVPVLWRYQTGLEDFAFPCPILSDTDAALWAALGEEDGLVVLSGTGSFVKGKRRGNELLVGGWGYALGDEGSGYALGLSALRHAARCYDRQETDDAICRGIMAHYGLESLNELKIRQREPDMLKAGNVAALCPVVERAAAENCPAALAILSEQSAALARQAGLCACRLGFEAGDSINVALTGGVLTNNPTVRARYTEALRALFPKGNIRLSTAEPISGAKDYVVAKYRDA